MKKKELLEHIRALQQRVALLEMQMSGKQDREIYLPSVWTLPLDTCPAGGAHEYPFPWHSTMPAPCKKCNQTTTYTITCSTPPLEEPTPVSVDNLCDCSTCVDNKCQCRPEILAGVKV